MILNKKNLYGSLGLLSIAFGLLCVHVITQDAVIFIFLILFYFAGILTYVMGKVNEKSELGR
jgi:hypothetical protein